MRTLSEPRDEKLEIPTQRRMQKLPRGKNSLLWLLGAKALSDVGACEGKLE
jgi:hypothetical protein